MKKHLFLLLAVLLTVVSNAFAYDFSASAPSGQTLYYKIVSGEAHLVRPGTESSYNNYVTGALTIPSSVSYNGTTYTVTALDTVGYYGAFEECSGLTSVSIPNSITSIGYSAFYNCSGLTSVSIPNSVTSIGGWAFYGCSSLTSAIIPNSVSAIGYSAFQNCISLTSVVFGADSCILAGYNSYYNYINNPIFGGSNLTNITFGNNVRHIPNYLCYNCISLTTVTIGSNVTSIGDSAFFGCTGLTTANYTGTIAQWCNIDFSGYSSNPIFYTHSMNINGSPVTNLIIPNGVNSIKQYAFIGCSGLTSVTIPNSVTSIGNLAFFGCPGLDTVYMMPTTPPTLGSYAFYNNASDRVFIIACSAYDNYYNAPVWSSYYSGSLRTPIIDINVTVQSSDLTRGTANVVLGPGNAVVRCDSTVVVQATANSNFHFDHWSNGSTANPYTLTLSGDTTITAIFIGLTVMSNNNSWGSASHTKIGDHQERITATANTRYHFDHWSTGSTANPATITLVGDSTVTAYFERNSYTLTANVNDATLGSLSFPDGDSALYQDTLTVVATPIEHHHVASWQGQGIIATSADKDTVLVKMNSNRSLVCNFAIDTHTVTVATNDIARGMVEATGTEFVYGTPCMVTATPYSGYIFAGWSDGSRHNPYTFAVISDTVLIARFLTEEEYEGIDDVIAIDVHIYQRDGKIVVEGAEGYPVTLYDAVGRRMDAKKEDGTVELTVPTSGVYMVKVGDLPARRVVVIR